MARARPNATDILLVGGGVASARCARTLRRDGFDGSITLVGVEPHPPYNRPPLSKELLREDLPAELTLAEPESWYARRNVELRTGTQVESLDLAARRALLDDGSVISYQRCLLALGAEPRSLPVEGGSHALPLRTLTDADRIREATAAHSGAPVTVIGGGFIGVELASSLATRGLRPTIVEMADRLWGGTLGTELDTWARARLADAGVEVRLGTAVTRLNETAAWLGDERLDHAFAVAGIGVRPRTELAERSGLAVSDGIETDGDQRTSDPSVWAAGDVARVAGRRVEHWHAAREQGERAALSMLGLDVPPMRASWVFSEVAGASFDVVGDAAAWDQESWIDEGLALAMLDGERVVHLALIGGAYPVDAARALVARGATPDEVRLHLVRA